MLFALRRFFATGQDAVAGIAAVEFGILAPVLAMMMVCTAALGMGIYRKMQVQSAAQAGAAFATTHGFNTAAIVNAITTSVLSVPISASPSPRQFCGCPSSSGIIEVSCDGTCDGGGPAGTYVTTSAQGTYTTILPYPLFDASYTFNAQATVRIQ